MTAMMQTQLTGFYYDFFFFAPELDFFFFCYCSRVFRKRCLLQEIIHYEDICRCLVDWLLPFKRKKSAASIKKCA